MVSLAVGFGGLERGLAEGAARTAFRQAQPDESTRRLMALDQEAESDTADEACLGDEPGDVVAGYAFALRGKIREKPMAQNGWRYRSHIVATDIHLTADDGVRLGRQNEIHRCARSRSPRTGGQARGDTRGARLLWDPGDGDSPRAPP